MKKQQNNDMAFAEALVTETIDGVEQPGFVADDARNAEHDAHHPAPQRGALSFTIVHGYLRGEHACPFELHATGCKDLRSKVGKQLYNFEVLGVTADAARDQAIADLAGTAKLGDIWVQPCCGLKRMRAAGRA